MARRAVITILDQLVKDIIQLHRDHKEKEIDHLRFTPEMVDEVNDRRDKACPEIAPTMKEFTFQGYRAIRVNRDPGVVLKWTYYEVSYDQDSCKFPALSEEILSQDKDFLSGHTYDKDFGEPIKFRVLELPFPSRRSWCGARCARNEEFRIVAIWKKLT